MELKTIALFGGTFDPVHIGHLRTALEVQQALQLTEMRLLPCKIPPHRPPPLANSAHRLTMLRLATEHSLLRVDDREMNREGTSYTIDSLMSARREYPEVSLSFVVRLDVFLTLPSWHQWENLIKVAHCIVTLHKGEKFPETGAISQFYKAHTKAPEYLKKEAFGGVIPLIIPTFEISAQRIRTLLKEQESPQFLFPEKVYKYVQKHKLYGYTQASKKVKTGG